MRRVAALAALLSLVSLKASPAHAASAEAERESRRHFQLAETRFRAGLFAEALAEYQSGYDVLPLPGFLINMAQCQRRMGDLKKARALYSKFLLVAPDSPLVPQVQDLIKELDKLLADLDDETPSATQATSPAAVAPPPPAAPPPAAPAPSPPTPSAQAAATLTATAPPPAAESERHTRWWLWGTIGAVVAAGAATAFVLASSRGADTIQTGSLGALRR
jgi:tetratricopeptide (TPR) repeat protein